MTKTTIMFNRIFKRVVGHEGGFQKNPKDRGNWTGGKVGVGELKGTKYGIAAHSYPHLDIENLTIEEAKAIYWEWFNNCQLNRLRDPMQYQMFDAAFNHGQKWANRFLQRAVGVDDDGFIGPKTLAATRSHDVEFVLMMFISIRTKFFTDLSNFDEFGKGWIRRIAINLEFAAKDSN